MIQQQSTKRRGWQMAWTALSLAAALAAGSGVRAANVSWIGLGSGSDQSGSWEATSPNVPWSSGTKPTTSDIAYLVNVATGDRTITINSPETFGGLVIQQLDTGHSNILTLNSNFTIASPGPFPMTTTTGDISTAPVINVGSNIFTAGTSYGGPTTMTFGDVNLGVGGQVVVQNTSSYRGNPPGDTINSSFGAVNMVTNSSILIAAPDLWPTAVQNFNGPLSVTGTGATITATASRWAGGAMAFNGGVNVTGAGSNLTVTNTDGGPTVFNSPGAGAAGLTVAAGASVVVTSPNYTYVTINGLTLAANPATKLTLKGQAMGTVATPSVLDGTVNLNTGSSLILEFDGGQGSDVLLINPTATVMQDGATMTWDWEATGNNTGSRYFTNAGNWTLQNGASVGFASAAGRAAWVLLGNSNSGAMHVLSGSTLNVQDLTNTGTLELGTSATMNGVAGTAITLTNSVGGTVTVSGSGVSVVSTGGMATVNNNGQFTIPASGLVVGAITGSSTFNNNAGTLSIASGATLTLNMNTGGTAIFNNAATFAQNGVTILLNWASASNNNVTSRFTNSGNWTLSGASLVNFTRQGVAYAGGFGAGAGNSNAGTLTLKDTSIVNFADLTNTGTIDLGIAGSNAGLGTSVASPTLTNGTNGVLNVLGTGSFGSLTAGNGTSNLYNGNGSSTGGQVNAGDGVTTTNLKVLNAQAAAVTNRAGNTFTLNNTAILTVQTAQTGTSNGSTSITNAGTFTQVGSIVFYANWGGTDSITNSVGGTYVLNGSRNFTVFATGSGITANTAFTNAGTLQGASLNDALNYTGTSTHNTLSFTNSGTIAPGLGTNGTLLSSVGALTLANTALTFATGTLALDIGGVYANPAKSDSLTLNGTSGGTLSLTDGNDTLNVTAVNGITPAGTYRIINATSVTGTFHTINYTGPGAAPTVTYGSNYINLVFTAAPTWSGVSGATWSGANWTGTQPNAIGAQANFGAAGSGAVVSVDGNETVGYMVFDHSGTNHTLAAGGGNLTLQVAAGGGPATITVANGSQTINAPLVFASNVEIATVGGNLTIGGNVTGAGTLSTTGAGSVVLTGANSYGGGTTVSAGLLAGTTASLQGNIVNNAAVRFDQTLPTAPISSGTYAGTLSGSGSVTKLNAGEVIFSGINSYTGGTTVSGGLLTGTTASLQGNIVNNAAVKFDQTLPATPISSGTYAGNLSGSGAVTKANAGEVIFTGTNNYGGGTTVTGGTLTFNSLNARPASGVLTLGKDANGGAKVVFTAITGATAESIRTQLKAGTTFVKAGTTATEGIGYLTTDQYNTLHPGAGLAPGGVIAKYTYLGDINLDGKITADDFAALDASYLKVLGGDPNTGFHWINGDLDYDGKITTNDFALLDAAYVAEGGGTLASGIVAGDLTRFAGTAFAAQYQTALNAQTTVVPEPASLGLLALGALGLMGRRRR